MIAEVQKLTFEDYLQEELAKLDLAEAERPAEVEATADLETRRVITPAAPLVMVPYAAFLRLGFTQQTTAAAVEKRFRKLSKQHHPDRGGDAQEFRELVAAKEQCLAYFKLRGADPDVR